MMSIEELLNLVSNAANGKDDLQKAAVGFYGYGFIFKDPRNSKEDYVITRYSGKFTSFGTYRGIEKQILQLDHIKSLDDFGPSDDKEDYLFTGSLKTLVPILKFGGSETLFDVWMFVKTPDAKFLPVSFYYGPSGTSLGGWHVEDYNLFPKSFSHIINSSPFDFSKEEREGLIEALDCALRKVPVSDFYGVYQHDRGNALKGVKSGVPFSVELGYEYDETDIEILLDAVELYREKFSEML